MRSVPETCPPGTRYVIEGRRGRKGEMRIVSRRVILPNGEALVLKPTGLDRTRRHDATRRAQARRS